VRELEFLHVIARVEKSDSWELCFGNTDELTESLLDSILNSGHYEHDLSLKVLGGIGENLGVVSSVILSISEKNDSCFLLSKDGFDIIL
jgi:hypothetical protein